MTKLQIRSIALGAALLVGAAVSSAQPQSRDFSNASLVGSYAAEEQGDGSVSAGLGVVRYDGAGKAVRRITVNAPDPEGGRRILVFESDGEYTVNPDGTGSVVWVNRITGGATTTDTFDFVITGVASRWVPGRGQANVATQLFAAQREAGLTVSLVVSRQTRIADE